LRALQFVAVILTALGFVPGGAHLFELPNKIALSERDYLVAQSIYRGWALFGSIIVAAMPPIYLSPACFGIEVDRFGRALRLDLYGRRRCSSFSNGLTPSTRQPTTGLW
jgi:hypothetical protein